MSLHVTGSWLYPLAVFIVGAVLWATAKPDQPKRAEAGRIAFFCGLFVLTLLLASARLP